MQTCLMRFLLKLVWKKTSVAIAFQLYFGVCQENQSELKLNGTHQLIVLTCWEIT